jgi:cell division protein FtsZ
VYEEPEYEPEEIEVPEPEAVFEPELEPEPEQVAFAAAAEPEPLPAPAAVSPLRVTPVETRRTAAEPERERSAGAYVPAATAETRPELVPVPASVFDDEFFRGANGSHEENRGRNGRWGGEQRNAPAAPGVQQEAQQTHWPEAKVPSFAGYAGGSDSSSESDELDIPAFLRRSR